MRINEAVLTAMQSWAEDELRSVNAQIEYVLREALRKAGRLNKNETGGQQGADKDQR
nr:Arc family DNA binding domain-containing protein [Pseudomarimonas arenosa]